MASGAASIFAGALGVGGGEVEAELVLAPLDHGLKLDLQLAARHLQAVHVLVEPLGGGAAGGHLLLEAGHVLVGLGELPLGRFALRDQLNEAGVGGVGGVLRVLGRLGEAVDPGAAALHLLGQDRVLPRQVGPGDLVLPGLPLGGGELFTQPTGLDPQGGQRLVGRVDRAAVGHDRVLQCSTFCFTPRGFGF